MLSPAAPVTKIPVPLCPIVFVSFMVWSVVFPTKIPGRATMAEHTRFRPEFPHYDRAPRLEVRPSSEKSSTMAMLRTFC